MKILILGGYGTFGGRLAQLLAHDERLTLLIAGRSLNKARTFCDKLPAGALRRPMLFDRNADVEVQIKGMKPDLVVDATGPFQSYGDEPYRVVSACIANGIDYMDLADGSDFVKEISQFDQQAKAGNTYVLSGVSSFPVLTVAVVRNLSQGFARVTKVTGGVAPSPYAGVGLNVIHAIAAYSGKRIKLMRDGKPTSGHALTETMRYTISPPGRLPLKNIRFSLVDVPDLQVMPELWPELESVWMGAGTVPEVLHRMLNGMAWLVRMKLLPSLSPLAPLFHWVINTVRWGERRGGMFVSVEGCDAEGNKVERSWHLLAEGNDGPLIPSMAVAAIVQKCLAGRRPVAGARPATRDLELEDYEALFSSRTIYTGRRDSRQDCSQAPLYQRLLGDAWASLPEPLKAMHECKGALRAEGVADVERGSNILARVVAAIVGFPKAGKGIPLQVDFQLTKNGELWRRTFAGKSFSSLQMAGRGRSDRLLSERFGPFTFGLALVVEDGKLNLVVRQWDFLGLTLPAIFAPSGNSYECVENGRFCFNVEIRLALIGLLVRYRGWLEPTE